MNGVWVCRSSDPGTPTRRPSTSTGREVTVTIDLKAGTERATVWTNDLTHAYVHENSAYSLMTTAPRPRPSTAGSPTGKAAPSPPPCRG